MAFFGVDRFGLGVGEARDGLDALGVGGNCKFPICGNRKPHTLVVGGCCPAFHAVGDVNSVGAGRLEGSVVETLRRESPDDPRVGRDGSVGPKEGS